MNRNAPVLTVIYRIFDRDARKQWLGCYLNFITALC